MKRHLSSRAVAAVSFAAALAAAAPALAAPRIAHTTVDGEKGELKLWVDVRKGESVIKSPEKSKLQILIDGKPLAATPEITTFGDNGDGYNIVFVVDASAGWDRNWTDIREAVKGFVSRMRGDKNKVAVVLLREGRVDTALEFTSEIRDVDALLDKTTETEGIDPRLFSAVETAIKMHAAETGGNWRRVIVFGTDMEDESAMDPTRYAGAYADLMKDLDKSDVEISTIFMTTKVLADGTSDVDPKILDKAKKLAAKSHGFYRELRGVTNVAVAYKEIADDINSMAVITIKPDAWPKEGVHIVGVKYDELDAKDVEVKFPPPPGPTDECEIDADCGKGQACSKGKHPWTCVEAEKPAPKAPKEEPFDLFKQWWFWVLCGLGGLGVIVLIIALIAGRSSTPEAPQAAPQATGSGCMECGQPNRQGPRCMEGCANRARGKLVCTSGNMAGKILYILDEITTFGKAPGNNYIIFDDAVSSKHFGVKIEDARFELADFGSTNGTYVNGTKATKQYLKVGDTIRVGHTEMTFQLK